MKKLTITITILLASFTVLNLTSCQETDDLEPNGRISFWTDISGGWSSINITVDGTPAGTITRYLDSPPNCDNSSEGGVVSVTRAAGTYNYTAQSNSGMTWDGAINFTKGGCATMQLAGSGGGSGGGNGGGSGGVARVSFRRTSAAGCTYLKLSFNGGIYATVLTDIPSAYWGTWLTPGSYSWSAWETNSPNGSWDCGHSNSGTVILQAGDDKTITVF